jgi:hypothetical protein
VVYIEVGMIEEEIINKVAGEMSREIDREVLWGFLKELGWTRVMIDRFQDNRHAVDITHWLADRCKGAHERNGTDFIFELEADAVNFILTWK